MQGCGKSEGLKISQKLCMLIQEHSFIVAADHQISITASIGLAYAEQKEVKFEQLYQLADSMLYRAKGNGKNRVELAAASV